MGASGARIPRYAYGQLSPSERDDSRFPPSGYRKSGLTTILVLVKIRTRDCQAHQQKMCPSCPEPDRNRLHPTKISTFEITRYDERNRSASLRRCHRSLLVQIRPRLDLLFTYEVGFGRTGRILNLMYHHSWQKKNRIADATRTTTLNCQHSQSMGLNRGIDLPDRGGAPDSSWTFCDLV